MAKLNRIALVELASASKVNIYAMMPMPRGLPLLAAELQAYGHEVVCYVEILQRFDWRVLLKYDMIGFSSICCTIMPTYRMIRKLRSAGYRGIIVLGGPHSTERTEEGLLAGANIVCRNEGDITFPELIATIEAESSLSKVLGISWTKDGRMHHNQRRPFLDEIQLSALPFPAFETIIGLKRMMHVPLNLSRGCHHGCTYCAVGAMFGRCHRCPSVEWRLSQLRQLKEKYFELWKRCCVFFSDDNLFGSDKGMAVALEMLQRMNKEELVPPQGFVCQMRVEDANIEVVQLLKEAGCILVCLGLESADPMTLEEVEKKLTLEQMQEGLSNLRSGGINVLAMTIAGADTDTFRSVFRSIRQMRKWDVTFLQILAMVPLPGTKMVGDLILKGRPFSLDYDKYDGHLPLIPAKQISKFGVWAAIYVSTAWFYFWTRHGRGLCVKYLRITVGMIRLAILENLQRPWRALKKR